MKKILLFLLAFFSLTLQAKGFRIYNAHPTQSIEVFGGQSFQQLTIGPKRLSQYLLGTTTSGLDSTGNWRYRLVGLPENWFDLFIDTFEDPVVVIEPVTGKDYMLKGAYAIELTEWQKRFGVAPEQKEQKAEAAGAGIPNFISIRLPDGNLANLDTSELDGISFTSTFKDLIEEQFAKGDAYILARVVDEKKKPNPHNKKELIIDEAHRPVAHYFDAHNFNFYFFKTINLSAIIMPPDPETGQPLPSPDSANLSLFNEYGATGTYPVRFQEISGMYDPVTREYSYLNFFRVPSNKLQINPVIGVQYFVLEPNKVVEGFKYLCTYTAVRGFHNDVATSFYKGLSQDDFLNIFYGNQNIPALAAVKAQAKARTAAIYKRLKEEAEAQERKLREEKEAQERKLREEKTALERKQREQAEEIEKKKGAVGNSIIHLPDGKTKEELDLKENEPYAALSSFQELIDAQAAKNDPFIIARVVSQTANRPFYFDAHALNQQFFADRPRTAGLGSTGFTNRFFERDRSAMAPGKGFYFEQYRMPQDNQAIDSISGIQYFIYNPKAPQNGFQYFSTYTKPRGFYNDMAGSPYQGRPQAFFIDYFYANQNEEEIDPIKQAALKKLKADAKARLPQLPAPTPAAPATPGSGEQKKEAAADLSGLSDDEVNRRASQADIQNNFPEAARLFEEYYRRRSARGDIYAQFNTAVRLSGLYFVGGNGLAPNYEKAKVYYTYVLDNTYSEQRKNEIRKKLQEIEAKLAAARASEQKVAAGAADLSSLTDDLLEQLAVAAYGLDNDSEGIPLFEELFRRLALRNDQNAVRLENRYKPYLASMYFNVGDYAKAKLYYTEMLNFDSFLAYRNLARSKLQEIADRQAAEQKGSEEEKKSAAQKKFEMDLKVARLLYEGNRDQNNYRDAIAKLLPIYRDASEAQKNEAACLLGEIYFKGGRGIDPDSKEAAKYFESILSGPCYDQAQEYMTRIAVEDSIRSAAQPHRPQQPAAGAEIKLDLAAAAARRQAAADAKLQDDANLAAGIAASMQPQSRPQGPSSSEQKAGAAGGQRVPSDVSNDLKLLFNSLVALNAAVR